MEGTRTAALDEHQVNATTGDPLNRVATSSTLSNPTPVPLVEEFFMTQFGPVALGYADGGGQTGARCG
ncbi:hypothetical protein OUZ56_020469 [Daphnia magna]|uniref:Uncharacterized protein n=1 Tax=Daphnia magna TaxID=35525 RepID=A0ABQ9ZEJ6_9CRUS|nr:hypothetical protein OUZ56_020469 [Daphnia magna]